MRLSELFETTDWTEEDLASEVGVDQSTINRLRNERRTASLGLAVRIERATKGAVRAKDLPLSEQAVRDLALISRLGDSKGAAA